MEETKQKARATLINVQFAQAITIGGSLVLSGIGKVDITRSGVSMQPEGDNIIVTRAGSDEYVKVYPSNIKFCTFRLEKEEEKKSGKNSGKN